MAALAKLSLRRVNYEKRGAEFGEKVEADDSVQSLPQKHSKNTKVFIINAGKTSCSTPTFKRQELHLNPLLDNTYEVYYLDTASTASS